MTAVAGLVPAETLALHAFLLKTITSVDAASGAVTTTDPTVFKWMSPAMVGLTLVAYLIGRWLSKARIDPRGKTVEVLKAAIPPLAFAAWALITPQADAAYFLERVNDSFSPGRATMLGALLAFLVVTASVPLSKDPSDETTSQRTPTPTHLRDGWSI